MEWTKDKVAKKMEEIRDKGFICIPDDMFRNDDGIVGQILEREFGVAENNLHLADLGTYELKGMRKKKGTSNLTLFHQTPSSGLSPIEIYDRFSYEGPSRRDGSPKRKLFTTIYGNKINKRGFILRLNGEGTVDLYYRDEYLATWDLTNGICKIQRILLALAETRGKANSRNEEFHFVEAYILSLPKNIYDAIAAGVVVMDLSIDQPASDFRKKAPHDRGPHIRIPIKKLDGLFESVDKII